MLKKTKIMKIRKMPLRPNLTPKPEPEHYGQKLRTIMEKAKGNAKEGDIKRLGARDWEYAPGGKWQIKKEPISDNKKKNGWLKDKLKTWKAEGTAKKTLDTEAWEALKKKMNVNKLSQSPENIDLFRKIRKQLVKNKK